MQVKWKHLPLVFGCFFVVPVACVRAPIVYVDINPVPPNFTRLIAEAPIVVVAVVEKKAPVGPIGMMRRPDAWGPFPMQRYDVTLRVRRVLRGAVPGKAITATGYETEGGGLIGPPQGICDAEGREGVYFLKRFGPDFRMVIDVYRSVIPLDRNIRFGDVDPNNLPITIWRLLLQPFVSGIRPPRDVNFLAIENWTGWSLGRARTVELLKSIATHSTNLEMQIATCLYLNERYGGCGGEQCVTTILGDRSGRVTVEDRAQLLKARGRIAEANASVREALRSPTDEALSGWAHSRDLGEIVRFLCLLTTHPDRQIADLARNRLRRIDCPKLLSAEVTRDKERERQVEQARKASRLGPDAYDH